jgi:hypothetical protein
MRCNLSTTDSSVLCLTWGGESSEDIIPELKRNHRHKFMKALIPVSPKKNLGIITAVKWTIPEITTSRNTTQTISRTKYAESQPK